MIYLRLAILHENEAWCLNESKMKDCVIHGERSVWSTAKRKRFGDLMLTLSDTIETMKPYIYVYIQGVSKDFTSFEM